MVQWKTIEICAHFFYYWNYKRTNKASETILRSFNVFFNYAYCVRIKIFIHIFTAVKLKNKNQIYYFNEFNQFEFRSCKNCLIERLKPAVNKSEDPNPNSRPAGYSTQLVKRIANRFSTIDYDRAFLSFDLFFRSSYE